MTSLQTSRVAVPWRASCAAALVLGASVILAGTSPVNAEKVGVAAAVNPDAFSSLSQTPNKQLNIGKSIFYNERINTDASGLVQVLLVDGSTFTVGPNSDLVIDRFVYDPQKKTGEMVATFSKGTMRFIGGKLSKNEGGVRVNTPEGALAIRGCIIQGSTVKKIYAFLYGDSLTFEDRFGHTAKLFQTGYVLDLTDNTPKVRLGTPEDANFFAQAFAGRGSVVAIGQTSNEQNHQPEQLIKTATLNDLVSDVANATADQIQNTLQEEEKKEQQPENKTASTTTTVTDTTTPDTPPPPPPPPPPQEITARVLTVPGVYTAFPGSPDSFTTDNAGANGVLGGDETPTVNADDFNQTFQIIDGRVVGTVEGLIDSSCVDETCTDTTTTTLPPAEVDFPWFEPGSCGDGPCDVLDATVTQDEVITNYIGTAVAESGFFAYQLIPGEDTVEGPVVTQPDAPLLAFGGEPFDFGEPSGRLYSFDLTSDIREQGALGPFASTASSPEVDPTKPLPTVSPLLFLEEDGSQQGRAVWLQTSFYINTTPESDGTPFDQQSFINMALGGRDAETGGLIGTRRGGSQIDVTGCGGDCQQREAYSFTGDIASLGAPDGSHFLGTGDPNIVVGADSTITHNIDRDTPLDPDSSSVQEQSSATYHVGTGQEVDPGSQTLQGSYSGYATGLVQSELPASGFINVVAGQSTDDFTISFDPQTNSLMADMTVRDVQNGDGATNSYHFGFGDEGGSDVRSAFIDDQRFAAIEALDATSVSYGANSTYDNATSEAYLVSGDQLQVTQYFPDIFEETSPGIRPICSNCEFMQWGAWGARVEFGNANPSQYVDNVHLGWWVAGDVTSTAALDTLYDQNASASYDGHAIGTVASRLNSNDWRTYVAAGDLDMYWHFGERAGNFEITKFDQGNFGPQGLTFGGPMNRPGQIGNHFAGDIGTPNGSPISLLGTAAGSFVNNGPSNPAAGVIGNWNVHGLNYRAAGVFAGSGLPVPGN